MYLDKQNLIWVDLEMTGLNPDVDKIIEIATLITDKDLNILAEGPNLAIYQKDSYINSMNKWNINIHSNSGLIDRVRNSIIDEVKAEYMTLKFIKKWVPEKMSPICGSTIAQDRRFLFRYMPNLESYFHYRYIDVSSFKEVIKRWVPSKKFFRFNRNKKHSALYDVKDSIYEMLYYKKYFFSFLNKSNKEILKRK